MGAAVCRRRVRDRGGDHATSPRARTHTRLITAGAALALGLALGVASATDTGTLVAAGGSMVFIAGALVSGRIAPLAIAIVLLGAVYVIPGVDGALPVSIYAGALLLTAELAWWSIDERVPARVELRTRDKRLAAVLAVVAGGTAAAALVQLAASTDSERSPTATTIAVAAALACLAVVALLGRARGLGGTKTNA